MSQRKPSLRISRSIENVTPETLSGVREAIEALSVDLGTMVANVTIYDRPEFIRQTLISPRELKRYHRLLRLPLGKSEAYDLAVYLDDIYDMGALDKPRQVSVGNTVRLFKSEVGKVTALIGSDETADRERRVIQGYIDEYYGTDDLDSLMAWQFKEPGAGFAFAKSIQTQASPLIKRLSEMVSENQMAIPDDLELGPVYIENSTV